MFDRIYLEDIKTELRYKDYRSVKKWCKINGVGLISDQKSKMLYALRVEFDVAKNNNALRYLDKKYGTTNPEAITAQLTFHAQYQEAMNKRKGINSTSKYQSTGEHEINFMSILSKFESE